MASREIDSRIQQQLVFNITNITSGGDKLGNITFDTAGFESVEFLIVSTDDFTDGTYIIEPHAGDESDPATHTLVQTPELTGLAPFIAGVDRLLRVGYIGKKRFVSTHVNATSVTTGARIGVFIIANTPRHAPTPANPPTP